MAGGLGGDGGDPGGADGTAGTDGTITDLANAPCCPKPPICQKGPVQAVLNPTTGRFPGNTGFDLTFRLDLGQDEDGHTSIQEMLDNATDKNGDGYILLQVVKDGTGQLGGHRTESIVINQNYPKGFGLIGCSVTLHDATPGDSNPTAHIALGAGSPTNIFVMDLHAADSGVAGWKVEGDGRYMRNVDVLDNTIGMWFVDNGNTMHNGAAEGNTGVGILIDGDGNKVDSADSFANGIGIEVNGNSNQLLKTDVGDKGKGNFGDGINVTGKNNVLSENNVFANGGNGIVVTGVGGGNTLNKNKSGDRGKANGLDGFHLSGGGSLVQNTAIANGGDGFELVTSGFSLKNNVSGGTGSGQPNSGCQYRFDVAGNTNLGGNKSNGVTLVGNPFPAGCK